MNKPAELGFYMPAEWDPHARCWMAWPCLPSSFPRMDAARDAFAVVAQAIARFEPLTMIANARDAEDARRRCGDGIEILTVPINDSWTRDTGPTWLVDGRGNLAGVDWQFNAYGRVYEPYADDDAIAARLLEESAARRFRAPITLEGGAIHSDGEGTLLTTDNVVLNPNRGTDLSKSEAEKVFRDWLGAERVIWLDNALEVDSTDGHVDNLACFAQPGLVLALSEPDPADPHHAPLQENLRRLRAARDAKGRRLEVLEIQQPARRELEDARICMSYINFYIANGAVVVPVFDDPADAPALEVLALAFPDREVVPVPGLEIVKSEGCVHCITQQQPLP
jgi:agmatine deiminase